MATRASSSTSISFTARDSEYSDSPDSKKRNSQNVELRSHVSKLQQQMKEIQKVVRSQQEDEEKIKRPQQEGGLSDDYSDDNPYSRLMALQTNGTVESYENIRNHAVAVIGCGGIGIQVCEMLTRCGVGLLNIYDRDKVTLAHMSRMFFRPEHTGWNKTQVSRHFLSDVNCDVRFNTFSFDIVNRYEDFWVSLRRGGFDEAQPVDLVLSCVDNRVARLAINEACHDLNIPWLCAYTEDDGQMGKVMLISPGRTACVQCYESGQDESPVHAALPTSDAVVAGLMAHAALKLLLKFGTVENTCINMLTFSMESDPKAPNPQCLSELCRQRQQELSWNS